MRTLKRVLISNAKMGVDASIAFPLFILRGGLFVLNRGLSVLAGVLFILVK